MPTEEACLLCLLSKHAKKKAGISLGRAVAAVILFPKMVCKTISDRNCPTRRRVFSDFLYLFCKKYPCTSTIDEFIVLGSANPPAQCQIGLLLCRETLNFPLWIKERNRAVLSAKTLRLISGEEAPQTKIFAASDTAD